MDGTDFEDKISKIDKKIPNVSGLVKKTDFNAKVTEIEGKIPSSSNLVTNSALNAVENKIPDVTSLLKKASEIQRLVKLKIKLMITIMTNILLLQNLIP